MSELAPDRIYGQYRTKPKAVQWYGITPFIAQGLCDGAVQVRQTYDIDTAEGAQLDTLGAIVVIPRVLEFLITQDVFQCGDLDAECGAEEVECAAAFGTAALTDADYRLLIRAKITLNVSDATIDSQIAAINFILESDVTVAILDNEDMTFSIQINGVLTPSERALLIDGKFVPKPQGVGFLGIIEIPDIVQCGDDTLQCGDENAECAGFTII